MLTDPTIDSHIFVSPTIKCLQKKKIFQDSGSVKACLAVRQVPVRQVPAGLSRRWDYGVIGELSSPSPTAGRTLPSGPAPVQQLGLSRPSVRHLAQYPGLGAAPDESAAVGVLLQRLRGYIHWESTGQFAVQ